MSPWMDGIAAPCDEDVFLAAIEAWSAGMEVPLRPADAPLLPGRLYLSDIPLNRAAMAAVRVLRERGVDQPQAYLWRLMHFGEILRAAQRLGFGELVRDDGVHTAVLRAAAVAKFRTAPAEAMRCKDIDVPIFDLEDVAAKVAEFRGQEAPAA